MTTSSQFIRAKRGSLGRRSMRHLDDARVAEALAKSSDHDHQFKFLSRSKKAGHNLRTALAASSAAFQPI